MKKLNEVIKRKNMSMYAMEKASGVGRLKFVHRITDDRGILSWSSIDLIRICVTLDCSISELADDSDDKKLIEDFEQVIKRKTK